MKNTFFAHEIAIHTDMWKRRVAKAGLAEPTESQLFRAWEAARVALEKEADRIIDAALAQYVAAQAAG